MTVLELARDEVYGIALNAEELTFMRRAVSAFVAHESVTQTTRDVVGMLERPPVLRTFAELPDE